MAEAIQTVSISKETSERYLRYALSVITSRALPDVRDGLKPVHRRILYTMANDLNLTFDGRPAKCARIVGDCMGKYHPHGDSAIYDALVRMAQYWMLRVPLIQGQGNFGSVDGDPPAAYRYTEAKLAAAADYLLRELGQDTVDLRLSYNNENREPTVLPAEYPNLLVNGSSGIAVGMATNIPPHNFAEVLRACVLLIDEPDATTADLLQKVKGPDFPLGGKIITDRSALKAIYETGTGGIKVQGEWKQENTDPKRPQIVVTSIPYGVETAKLELEMAEIIEAKKLPQVLSLINESNAKEGLRLAMDVKPGTDAAMVMAYFYKHTALQDTFSYNMTCLVPEADGSLRPKQLGLKEMLRQFLVFRLATVRRRFEWELRNLRRRIHILDGFRIVFDDLDKAIRIIRSSSGKSDAATKLMAEFPLDADQTTAILDSQLYKIASMEIQKILEDLREKKAQAQYIEELLADQGRLWQVVRGEFEALAEAEPGRRRTRMASDEDVLEFDEEAYIVRENTNVVLTRDGWLKRVGRLASVEGTRVRDNDEVVAVAPGSTVEPVAFFSEDGTAYTMRISDVPASSGYGEPISKFFKIADQIKIIAAITGDPRFTPDKQPPASEGDPDGPYLLTITSAGMVSRIPFELFRTASTKNGRRFVRLGEGEKVVLATILSGTDQGLFLASESGRVIHFAANQIPVTAGAGKGVVGLKIEGKDRCIGGTLVSGRFDALRVETSGEVVKEFRRGAHPAVNRGGRGTEVVKRAKLTRVLPSPILLADWEAAEEGNYPWLRVAKPEPEELPPERNGEANGHAANGNLFD